MKPFSRSDRVGGLMKEAISDILRKDIKDPRLEMTVITSVNMSNDLRNARVYFSTSGGKAMEKKASAGFKSALGYIKRQISSELELRYMPDISFFYDESFDYGAKIDKLLASVNTDGEKERGQAE